MSASLDPQLLPVFLIGALALNVTPGPDMAFTLANAAKGGVRAGLAAAAGVSVGSLAWSVFAAMGLAAFVAASDQALLFIRIAGGLYLLYLAWRTLKTLDKAIDDAGAGDGAHAGAFRSGLATNLLNPKVGIFFLAFLPAFVAPESGPVWLQTFVLGAIFSTTGFFVLVLVAFAAGAVREHLVRSKRLRVGLNGLAATAFAGLGLHLLFGRNG